MVDLGLDGGLDVLAAVQRPLKLRVRPRGGVAQRQTHVHLVKHGIHNQQPVGVLDVAVPT